MNPILVTGDPDRNKVQTMPGGAFVTIRIDLPADWDALMAERGYRPLATYFLDEQAVQSVRPPREERSGQATRPMRPDRPLRPDRPTSPDRPMR
jgi:hypothetical protein